MNSVTLPGSPRCGKTQLEVHKYHIRLFVRTQYQISHNTSPPFQRPPNFLIYNSSYSRWKWSNLIAFKRMWEELVALWDAAHANAAGSPVKLAEVYFPSAKKAGMDLELSHSSEHLNLAEREVSRSWDFIARSWFPSFAEDLLYKMSGGPVRHIKGV